MYYPDLEQARELAAKYNRIPVYKEMDISEPGILMLLKAIQEEHDMIFLESAHGDGSESRFSFIGYNPHTVYYFVSPYVIERRNGNSRIVGNDLFGFIKEKTSAYSSPSFEDYGNFNGGLAGYLGYECVNQTGILRRPVRESNSIPQAVLMDLDDFICHDNVLGKFYISTSIYPTEEGLSDSVQ